MNVRIQYETNFTAGVAFEGEMIMNTFKVRVWIATNTEENENHNIAFERLKYFLAELDSGIFIDMDEIDQAKRYIAAGLNVTTLPGDPVDQVIGIMLFYKLNAIMEDRISVLETEISSMISEGVTYMHSESENVGIELPAWWTTPDLIHCDIVDTDTENVVTLHRVGAWRDINLAWPDEKPTESTAATENNTVVYADFSKDKE